MDLPTCPSCHQSVIDDEAEDCPFCGASMSGPRQPKPTPAASATKPKAAPKPQAKKSSSSSPAAKTAKAPAAPQSDDPFDVQGEKITKYVRLRVKPKPGREFRVVCPMCETAGYTSEQAAGKPVRCINPDCLMPIFDCPEPEKEPEPEPETSSGMSAGMLTALAILLLGGGGFGVWWFVLREDPNIAMQKAQQPALSDDDLNKNRNQTDDPANTETDQNTNIVDTEPEKATPAEIRQAVMAEMVKYSEHTPQMGNRDPAYDIQMIASTLASRGDEAAVREQLARLSKLGVQRPDYRIIPLTDLAWEQMSAGESAEKTVNEALELSQQIQGNGQPDWRAITSLAAVLVAQNRADQAVDLLSQLRSREDKEVYWAKLQSLREDKTYNFARAMQHSALVEPSLPSWVSMTGTLVNYGKIQEALAWANRISDVDSRAEALAKWGENIAANQVAQSQSVSLTGLEDSLTNLSPENRRSVVTRVYARVARRLAAMGQTELAKTWVEKADAKVAKSPAPSARTAPNVKELYDYDIQLPWSKPLELAAIATAETAAAHRQLGQSEKVQPLLDKTRTLIAAITPPFDAMEDLVKNIDQNAASVQDELGKELNLVSDDQKRTAYKRCRRNAYDLRGSAEKYAGLQTTLIAKANGQPVPELASYHQELEAARTGGDIEKLTRLINSPPRSNGARIDSVAVAEAAMTSVGQLVEAGQIENALSFVKRLEQFDPAEDAAEFLGGAALTVQQDAEAVQKTIDESDLTAVRRVAAYRGFIAALNAKFPDEPVSDEEKSDEEGRAEDDKE